MYNIFRGGGGGGHQFFIYVNQKLFLNPPGKNQNEK
jgi:hypothetical protein